MKSFKKVVTLVLSISMLFGVAPAYAKAAEADSDSLQAIVNSIEPVDYAKDEAWVMRPDSPKKNVDIFMVMPTLNMKNMELGNEDITNEKTRSRFSKMAMMEAGLGSDVANVYVPYYRQKSIGCYVADNGYVKSVVPDLDDKYGLTAYKDISDAFKYYLKNNNNGHSIVLFGYSQGAEMLLDLLIEFENNDDVMNKLVAAYAVGASVRPDYLKEHPGLKMAQSADDTGVIISYNAMDARAAKADYTELATNPLNWKADSTKALKAENLGLVKVATTGEITEEIPNYCGAYIDENGKLIVTEAADLEELYAAENSIFPQGDYHLNDVNFFYRNLQQNIKNRVEKFK